MELVVWIVPQTTNWILNDPLDDLSLQQAKHRLRKLVRLGQHGNARLTLNLLTTDIRHFLGYVRITNSGVCRGEIDSNRLDVVRHYSKPVHGSPE